MIYSPEEIQRRSKAQTERWQNKAYRARVFKKQIALGLRGYAIKYNNTDEEVLSMQKAHQRKQDFMRGLFDEAKRKKYINAYNLE